MNSFGAQLKKLRSARQMTQQQLADELEISRSAVGSYEQGVREPSVEIIYKVASAFDVSMDFLLGTSQTEGHFSGSPESIDYANSILAEDSEHQEHSYYINQLTADMADDIKERYHVLFDACADVAPEDLEQVISIIKTFKKG